MARVPSKHGRDQVQDFEGLLNNLQEWELSFKEKEKKIKSQSAGKEKLFAAQRDTSASELSSSTRANGGRPVEKYSSNTGAQKQYDYFSHLSGSLMTEDSPIDANSEKDLGNEFFKQKKFNEAIDCYSRSIALSPTAVAYANRAMAYLKIKRFQQAENDCTEALNLDDRYIKAYSRRVTARKELRKLKESIADAEFALRLEPNNQEIKKQYAEVKVLYEKAIPKRASQALGASVQGREKAVKSKLELNKSDERVESGSSSSRREAKIQEGHIKDNNREAPAKISMDIEGRSVRTNLPDTDASTNDVVHSSNLKNTKINHNQVVKASVQELASRAASLAMSEAAKSITPPSSAYQFEASWRGFSGDRKLQAQLLKVTSPVALPRIFKNALTAPLLMDILRCIATFFREDVDLAVKYLENLTNVPRFDVIIMCLSSSDKADLQRIWDEVFSKGATEYTDILGQLRIKYGLKQ